MKNLFFPLSLLLMLALTIASCKNDEDDNTPAPATKYKVVKLETDCGNLMIWLYEETPQHRQNFIQLVESGFYDSLLFHRVVSNFVIQGGDPEGTGYGGPGYNIPAEFISQLTHVYGAVGAARMPDNVNPNKESNGSQFYIVVNQNGRHDLDGDYTVFGLVFQGMNIAMSISLVAVDTNDRPLTDVYMKKLTTAEYTAAELKNNFGFTVP
jgi:cyclophilin family peptidyl-prolyl cis-trans isomerase